MSEIRNYKVYVHINKINGKRYYGITSQKYASSRWAGGKGYRDNKHFTSAINKYGWKEGFEHEVLFDNLTEEEAKLLEQMYIALYDTTNKNKGYNITNGGESANGFKGLSGDENPSKRPETRKKISDSHKGKNNPMYGKCHKDETIKLMRENSKSSKKVLCVELNKIFNSVSDANEYFNKDRKSDNIGCCARGKTKTAYGYHWEYIDNIENSKEAS